MFKEKLMTALEHAVRLYNADPDANAAVIKTAEAFDFNSDQTQRLIELFNTAHAVAHYKAASDKTGTFALAQAPVVIEKLFDAEKMAELMPLACQPAVASYSEYDRPERGTIRSFQIKVASFTPPPSSYQPTPDMSLNRHLTDAYGRLDAMKRAQEEIRRARTVCQLEYGRTLEKMAGMFRRNYPAVAGEILSTLTKYAVSEHGEEGGYAIADMAGMLPDYKLNVKYAGLADTDDIEPFLPHLDLVVKLREEMGNLDKLAVDMKDEAEGFAQGLKDALSPFGQAGLPKAAQGLNITDFFAHAQQRLDEARQRGFEHGHQQGIDEGYYSGQSSADPVIKDWEQQAAKAHTETADAISEGERRLQERDLDSESAVQNAMADAKSQALREQAESLGERKQKLEEAKFEHQRMNPPAVPSKGKAPSASPKPAGKSLLMENIINPWIKTIPETLSKSYDARMLRQRSGLQEKVDNLQRQEVLTDLLSNDPVLATEDPNKIARIYESIWQMAPVLTRQKEVMRAILRAAAQTVATDPYDVTGWTSLEKNLMQIINGVVGTAADADKGTARKQ